MEWVLFMEVWKKGTGDMKVLVTGFDPFAGEAVNPSMEVLKGLADQIDGAQIERLELPTVFGQSAQVLAEGMERIQPDLLISLGQAGGRTGLSLERVAINVDDARIPDNAGQQPIDQAIQEGGPAAYFSTLPIKAMVKAIHQVGLPAWVSNSAGTFVCNHLMYQALYLVDQAYPGVRAGFIHVPYLMDQVVDKPCQAAMSLADMVKGLEAAIQGALGQLQGDIQALGGQLH